MKKYILLNCLFFCLLSTFATSLPFDVYDREIVIKDFFLNHFDNDVIVVFDDEKALVNIFGNEDELFCQLNAYPVLEEESQAVLATILYNDNMFLAISHYKIFKPIKAFSLDAGIRYKDADTPIGIQLIEGMYQSDFNNKSEVSFKSSTTTPAVRRGDITMYGPWVSSLFGQVNCYDASGNIANVTNYYTPSNYAAGCVAITLTTVLDYFKWPPIGVGTSSYSDTRGSSTGSYSANYGGRFYDWDNVLRRYDNRESTDVQRKALGKVAYDTSVALRTNYEATGSSADIIDIPTIIKAFFRFSYANYLTVSSSSFWTQVDRNVLKRIPIPFAISSTTGSVAHAIVCDGLYYDNATPDDKMYHLNMGWWGDGNGWYDIQGSFNASSYSKITAGVFNFTPIPYGNEIDFVPNTDSIIVSWQFPEVENHKLEGFELQMHTGDGDWADVVTLDSGVFAYTLESDLQSDYHFRVRALTSDYTSDYSNTMLLEDYPASIVDHSFEGNLTVYPSITSSFLNVTCGESFTGPVDIRIYDMLGNRHEVQYVKNFDNKYKVEVQHLVAGNYIVSVSTKDASISQQFLKRN